MHMYIYCLIEEELYNKPTAVIWSKYCRYNLKHYIINQLINLEFSVDIHFSFMKTATILYN